MDEQRLQEARSGNKQALARMLYDSYEMVYKYLIKFTLNVNTAEDLTQETMVRAIEKFQLYNPEKAKFSTWLITIAQNIYLDNLRRVKRETRYIKEQALPDIDFLKTNLRSEDDSWSSVLDSLAKLDEESRFPVILKHYYGYSLEEIAKIMSIPVGTVKSRIYYALKALRKELD